MWSAGLAVTDIPEDSGVELGSGWGPALTSYRDSDIVNRIAKRY